MGGHSSAQQLGHPGRKEAQLLADAYEVDEGVLGKGGYGTVRRARLRAAPAVVRAVKTVPKRNLKAVGFVKQEIAILRRLDHPCICRIFESFEDDRVIALVLEFVEGRELFDEINDGGLESEHAAASVMRQVLSALQYCHRRNVIHRDLKPDNIMVQRVDSPLGQAAQLEVKVIDFGLAVMSSSRPSGSPLAGTADYLAPEARWGECMPSSDLWSLGVVLHALLVGALPRLLGDPRSAAISGPDMAAAKQVGVSLEAQDLISGLLRPDPARRLSAAAAAAHPWMLQRRPSPERPVDGSGQSLLASMSAFAAFHRSQKLRRALLTAVAMQLSGPQLRGPRAQFLHMDVDGNGRISREELVASMALASCSAGRAEKEVRAEAAAVFDAVYADGAHEIEYTEWLAATMQEGSYSSEEVLRGAFRIFDVDCDGIISQRELERILVEKPEEISALMPDFDANGDGAFDFCEFKAVVEQDTRLER